MLAKSARETTREFETAELKLRAMGSLGDTVADFEGGSINVFGGIPGERVIARIYRYRRRKKHIVSAMVDRVLEPSVDRVAPPCPYYGPCSGCQWQHVSYQRQLYLKRQTVEIEFSNHPRLASATVAATLPAPSRFNYRNHARFTVRFGGQIGFSNRITRRFVRIDDCMLMDDGINEALTGLQDRAAETTNLSVRYGSKTGDRLVQPTLKDPRISVRSGQTHYVEELLGQPFRIASPSFFQVNTAQAERLVTLVRDRLALKGDETIVDAYAGVGVFAIMLAPHVERSIAVEESHAAIEDARKNAGDLRNVVFVEAKTEHALTTLVEDQGLAGPPDVVILDPPRVGCQREALDALLAMRPSRVVYVSCDPPSLARDLDILLSGGYTLDTVEPVDMFPQTYHVECVATLSASPRPQQVAKPDIRGSDTERQG
jgi:23S rRNA (uracil1939-C5)-methyltransferase